MSMRELIDTIDLMETDLNRPLPFQETFPGMYFFSFRTPDGKLHTGEIAIEEASTRPYNRNSGDRTSYSKEILSTIGSEEDVYYGSLMYSIDEGFHGFNTQGFSRQILSTVVAATMDWLKKHPSVQYLVYTAATKDGTNNRPGVYQALSILMSKKYGFKLFSNNPKRGDKGFFVLQVKS